MCVELSIVIPVYGSAATLQPLVAEIHSVMAELGIGYEIILVDDGSVDESWQVMETLHRLDAAHVSVVQLMRNYGQHNALMCGIRRCRGQYIATLDDDLQNPPKEIPRLYRHIRETGLDLVYGSYDDKKHRGWRNLGSWVVNVFYRLTFKTSVRVTSYRIFTRTLAECIFPYGLNFTFVDGLLAWNTQRIGALPVQHHPRRAGRSGYSLCRLVMLALNLFTNFSLWPLQALTVGGLVLCSMGLLGSVYYLLAYLLAAITVSGYASIIIAVLTLGGFQLLGLGVMGEYLGRVHLNVNRKPQYVERQVLGQAGEPLRG